MKETMYINETFVTIDALLAELATLEGSEKAVRMAKAVNNEMLQYVNSVELALEQHLEAVNNVALSFKGALTTNNLAPAKTNTTYGASSKWLAHFTEMCDDLATTSFSEIDNGKVYIEHDRIMFKSATIANYMTKYYGNNKKFHVSMAQTVLSAESKSIARQKHRARAWQVVISDVKHLLNQGA